MRTKLLAGSIAVLLAGATGLIVLAGPGDSSDEPTDTIVVEGPDLEPHGLSEPPVIDDGEGDEGSGAAGLHGTEAIADEFGVSREDVLALHDDGIGFGVLFKLYSLARAQGMTVDELLASIESEGGGYAFGKLKKELSEEEQAALDDGPKNLGQLVSESKKNDKGGGD